MCNGTWVCFVCRVVIRRPTWRAITFVRPWLIGSVDVSRVPCSKCGELCQFLGPTIEVPPKRDAKAWKLLRQKVARVYTKTNEEKFSRDIRRTHEIEKRIRELQSRHKNAGRLKIINRHHEAK